MKEELIKIADYAESLEQQMVALEQRIAFLEQQAATTDQLLTTANEQIAALGGQVIAATEQVTAATEQVTALKTLADELKEQNTALTEQLNTEAEARKQAEQNATNLAEQVASLVKTSTQHEQQVSELGKRLAQLEAEVADELVDNDIAADDDEEEEVKVVAKPAIKREPKVVEHKEKPVEQPQPAEEPKVVPQPAPEPKPAPQPAAQKSGSMFGAPVADIRKAISIGDRFLFQRELFAQNVELMQRTLEEINDQVSFDDAVNYINSHFDWDKESQAYELFINTLHRRFN